MYELVTEATLENVGTVLDFVESHLDDCSVKLKSQIGIAVDEIFSNIARYAYDADTGRAAVRILIGDDDVTIEFEDSGTAYNPLEKTDPDVTLSAGEREIGGLGIFIVKKTMDYVDYRRDGEKNILTIKKSLC